MKKTWEANISDIVKFPQPKILQFLFRMTEQLQADMTNQTLLVQKDALYSAGATARQELSTRLTAAAFDFNLDELDQFTNGPSFRQDDTDEAKLKKLIDLRKFAGALAHKILKLQSANFVHFETTTPLAEQIQACTEKLNNFGLVDESPYNVNEFKGEIQALQALTGDIQTEFEELKGTTHSQIGLLDSLSSLEGHEDALVYIAGYSKRIKAMWDQAAKLDKIEDVRSEILNLVKEMPAFQIRADQADADIQELKNQNSLLNTEVIKLRSELALRPTLAILRQEINKYSSGDRIISSAAPSGGLQGLPKLDKLEPKNFRAFRTQFKHFALLSNWTPNQEAMHLPLALSQNISGEMMRCIPRHREMTADEILECWYQRICPTSVRDIAIAQMSKLQQQLNEDNRTYLDRAEQLYMDSQDPSTDPNPNTDSSFIQVVTNGIKDANIRRIVRDKRSQTFNDLRDNWRRACADFEIDQGVTYMETNISELEAPKNDKKPVLQPCFTCHSTSHKVKECPISKSIAKREFTTLFKAMRGKGGKNRGRGGKQGGKNSGKKFFPKAENVKKEPKN